MKRNLLLILALIMLVSGCANVGSANGNRFGYHAMEKTIRARITYYNSHEDKYHNKVACSSKLRAKQGITVAAHPDFKFGTRLDIPSLKYVLSSEHFVVQDRGSAVTSKRASHHKAYVFDVYVNSRRMTKYLEKTLPEYMDVVVE